MLDINIKSIMDAQRRFFATGQTLSIDFRIDQLTKLKTLLHIHEVEIVTALKKDLNKSETEAVVTEIILLADEIDFIIKNLKKWARPIKVHSPFPLCWPGRSTIHLEPYGSVLIIAPWNFPFMLSMSPLIGAMCAGNCAILKPSEISIHTQEIIFKIINEHFSPEYITAIKAGPNEVQELLEEKFDYIFFTGGTHVGKMIMQAAAKQLTPITLELGGKSPCIVDESANLAFAARRIMWAKLMNAGQVCLSPDYVLVHHSCKLALIENLKKAIMQFYGEDPAKSTSYGRIINTKHFDRLVGLMKNGNILHGGIVNESDQYISPTLIDEISWEDPIMQEEIFGPLLPILSYDNLDKLIADIKSLPKPLSLYLFTKNMETEQKILQHIPFGGGCINDCLSHIANYHLPFGGIGSSGIGFYHGKYSFETFSHRKSIFKKTYAIDLNLAYPPYTKKKLSWLRRLL
jgi:aldehyde dehydrogenase (NAD+)